MNKYKILNDVFKLDEQIYSEDFFDGSDIKMLDKPKTESDWRKYIDDFRKLDYSSPNGRHIKLKDMYYALNPNSTLDYNFVPLFIRAEMLETCMKQLVFGPNINRNLFSTLSFLMMSVPLNTEKVEFINNTSPETIASFLANVFSLRGSGFFRSITKENLYKVIDLQLKERFSTMTQKDFGQLKIFLPLLNGGDVCKLIEEYKMPEDVITEVVCNKNKNLSLYACKNIFLSCPVAFKLLRFPLQKSIEEEVYKTIIGTFEVPKDEQDKDAVQEAENILLNLVLGGSSFSLSVVRDLCERYDEASKRSAEGKSSYEKNIYLTSLKNILRFTSNFKTFDTIVSGNYNYKDEILYGAFVSNFVDDCDEYKNFIENLCKDFFTLFREPSVSEKEVCLPFLRSYKPIEPNVCNFISNAILSTVLTDETYDLILKKNDYIFLMDMANSKFTPPKYNELLKEKSIELKLYTLFKERFFDNRGGFRGGFISSSVISALNEEGKGVVSSCNVRKITDWYANGFETVNNIKKIAKEVSETAYCDILLQLADKLENSYKLKVFDTIKEELFSDISTHIFDMRDNYHNEAPKSLSWDVYMFNAKIQDIINKINSIGTDKPAMTAVSLPKSFGSFDKVTKMYFSDIVKEALHNDQTFLPIGNLRLLLSLANSTKCLKELCEIKELPTKFEPYLGIKSDIDEPKCVEKSKFKKEER